MYVYVTLQGTYRVPGERKCTHENTRSSGQGSSEFTLGFFPGKILVEVSLGQ